MWRGVLDQVSDGGDEFTPCRESLDESQRHHQERSGDSDGRIGGEESHEGSRDRHHSSRSKQGDTPSVMVGDVAEDGTAAETHDITGGKDPENRDDGDQVVALREEEPPKSGSHHSVKGEVIPLHHVAGHSGDDGDRFEGSWCWSSHARVSLMRSDGLEKNPYRDNMAAF